jgi:TolA-binding protein
MKRLYQKSVCGLTVLAGLFASSMARADLDKDAEKAKKDKEIRPVMEGQDEQGHEDYHRQLAKEGEENLKEINRLLDEIQKSMAQKETGAGTQEKQRRAVERMESLIKELGKP